MSDNPQLILNSRAKNFDGRHPWVMAKSVVEPTMACANGQVVELVHADGRWIGRGVYNAQSRIRVRLYQWQQAESLDTTWLVQQLDQCWEMRRQWMTANTSLDAFRLVNSEGDGLSGLVIDCFGEYCVIQINALAAYNWLDSVLEWVKSKVAPAAIRVIIDRSTARKEGLEAMDYWPRGESPGKISMTEHGVQFQLELSEGQKTGAYLDQRHNRQRAASWIASVCGDSDEGTPAVLDVCTYHGGFALAIAKRVSRAQVTAVDSSARALEQAQENSRGNNLENIDFQQSDCFDYLADQVKQSKKYRAVVLDPPRMASSAQQLNSALRAYYRLNLNAAQLLEPGGVLVSCSCTGRVLRSDLVGVLSAVAKRSRRRIQIVENLGADFDHPVDVSCPEGEYLKCLICRVW